MDIKPISHGKLMDRINKTEVDPRPPMDRIPYQWRDYAKINGENRRIEASVKMETVRKIFSKLFGGKKRWKQS